MPSPTTTMKHLVSIALLLSSPAAISAANDKNEDTKGNDKKPGKTDAPTFPPSHQPTPFPTVAPSVTAPPSLIGGGFLDAVNETLLNETFFSNETQSPSVTPSAQPSYSPTLHPTLSPSATPSAFPSSSPTLSAAPSTAPWTYVRPPRPTIRFSPWNSLNETLKEAARNLFYDEYTWENYGANDVEYWGWNGMSGRNRGNATLLGFDQRSWYV